MVKRCFMDFSVESQPVGRVIFELYDDVVPKTVENFRALCTGSVGVNAAGTPLYYKGTPLHRIIGGFMVQGGDFTLRNGKGGESIYGGVFDDEDLRRDIDEEGLLVMANRGKNTNGSQFFVSLRPCPHLAGKHVVFGKVVKGFEVIEGLSKLPTNEKDVPTQLVLIQNCGELERKGMALLSNHNMMGHLLIVLAFKSSLAPAPKVARSPSPLSDRSRSRSRSRSNSASPSRSPSPELRRSSSKRHRSHRERDENGKKIKKHRSSHKSKKDKDRSSKKVDEPVEPTAEELAAIEGMKRVEEMEVIRKAEAERVAKLEREKALLELQRRYERVGDKEGAISYKGRGSMRAPDASGRSSSMRGW